MQARPACHRPDSAVPADARIRIQPAQPEVVGRTSSVPGLCASGGCLEDLLLALLGIGLADDAAVAQVGQLGEFVGGNRASATDSLPRSASVGTLLNHLLH